jgi:hypothetical protein
LVLLLHLLFKIMLFHLLLLLLHLKGASLLDGDTLDFNVSDWRDGWWLDSDPLNLSWRYNLFPRVVGSSFSYLHISLLNWDSPVLAFLKEMDFIVPVLEVGQHISLVSEVVDHVQERLAISVNEVFIIDLLDLRGSTEVVGEKGSSALGKDINFSH